MMAGYIGIKTVLVAGIIAIASAGGLSAQQVITLDNDVCARGLKALGDTLQSDIKTLTPARKIAGTCKAQKVRLKGEEFELEIGGLQWPSGTLIALESGKLPKTLNLTITRARVISAPADDPIWGFFKAQSAGGKRMDAKLGFRYKAEENELIVEQANVDFKNGNSISLRARLGGVNAALAGNPAVATAGFLIKRIELRLASGRTSSNPVLVAALDAIKEDLKAKELGGQDFKKNLKTLVSQELGPTLDAGDVRDLQSLIIDAPRAKDDILLQMNSTSGFAMAPLLLIKPEDRLATVMSGFEVKFAYGPRAH